MKQNKEMKGQKSVTVTLPISDERSILQEAYATIPPPIDNERRQYLMEEIKALLKSEGATLIAHYYTDPDIQQLAEESGGKVADSLEMARFGRDVESDTLVVAGVRFMGETAKILSPDKTILMADLDATCSLDLGCPVEPFSAFCDQHPDRTVVVYANTSAEVKARADWVVTSAIGLDIVRELHEKGEKIIWGPDQHLGNYIERETGADMLIWQGNCVVHNEFKASELKIFKEMHPHAKVLAHPESPQPVLELADIIGSTTQLITAAQSLPDQELIVATDRGIFYKMQEAVPDKTLLIAPTAGESATCKSCALCPWMAMNSLEKLAETLKTGNNEIKVDETIATKARLGIDRMLNFSEKRAVNVQASGDLSRDGALFEKVGAV